MGFLPIRQPRGDRALQDWLSWRSFKESESLKRRRGRERLGEEGPSRSSDLKLLCPRRGQVLVCTPNNEGRATVLC